MLGPEETAGRGEAHRRYCRDVRAPLMLRGVGLGTCMRSRRKVIWEILMVVSVVSFHLGTISTVVMDMPKVRIESIKPAPMWRSNTILIEFF